MRNLISLSVLLLAIVGCTLTPLQECQMPLRRALADNQAQIDDARLNIQRGAIYIPAKSSIGVRYCATPQGNFHLCLGVQDGTVTYRKMRIDVAAEQAKLNVLLARRNELEASYAQCSVRFPAV
ncbi:MAG: hypothetical protein GY945_17040 [Rhodobacteraceae bacterium]|nr:hypothetical protein [Paracoccaceae bacterium]